MRVLLTGSAGFIGAAIRRALQATGAEVVAVDLMLPAAHGSSTVPADTHQRDVRDAAHWADLLDGIDVVCHQSAMVGAGVTPADLPRYAAHNDLGTAALLAAMSERDAVKLVLASSMVVYGEGVYVCAEHDTQPPGVRAVTALAAGEFDNRCPVCAHPMAWALVDEAARLDPRSSYAASKVAQEHYALAWARQAAGSVVALRYHNVYGPGMPRNTPYSGVAAIFRSALERGEAPRVFEDGGQMRDFVHVDDVARANLAAIKAVLAADPGSFAAYNVCSGVPVSILDVARLITHGGQPPMVTGEYRLGDVRHIVASPARAEAELGFRAEVMPEVGLPAFRSAPLRA
ncbi:MAG: NAD-dependent epimerase/dehydratase family protein [Nocardioides sp.]